MQAGALKKKVDTANFVKGSDKLMNDYSYATSKTWSSDKRNNYIKDSLQEAIEIYNKKNGTNYDIDSVRTNDKVLE
jgi:hypothetical protein